jgi:hypothetical protein
MTNHGPGVSSRKNICITDLARDVETGAIHLHAALLLKAGRDRLDYIEELSSELGRLARHLDEPLLAYFFEMAAHEARDAYNRWGNGQG